MRSRALARLPGGAPPAPLSAYLLRRPPPQCFWQPGGLRPCPLELDRRQQQRPPLRPTALGNQQAALQARGAWGGGPEHLLLDGTGRHEPDHQRLLRLPDPVDARLGL
jgi:hypothetical protein